MSNLGLGIELSHAAQPSVFQVDARNELGDVVCTSISGEHPLTLYLDKRELVTLMTLGAAPELLSLGYLRNQRFIDHIDQIASIQVDWESESVAITSKLFATKGTTLWEQEHNQIAQKLSRKTVTTGCGQGTVYGDLMDDLDHIQSAPAWPLYQRGLLNLLEQMRKAESIYKVAGAVHGCALFEVPIQDSEPPRLLNFVEDVGRHNAVDAIAGWMWLNFGGDSQALAQRRLVFYTTGRLTSEMVIKAAQMGIRVLVSRSGLTHMGYSLAKRLHMTLIGRCQGRHFLVFSGNEHFVHEPELARYAPPS